MCDREQLQQETTGAVGRSGDAAPLEVPGLLSAIIEQTTDAVFVKDLEGRYLLVNSACTRILRRPKEEIVGRDDAQILPPETAERLAEVDRLVLDTGEASSYEEVLPVGGRPRTYLSTKSVHRDAAGNAAGIIGISRDITERKRAEQELMRREEQFRSLAEGVNFIPWEADLATWRFTYVGPQAVEILGYPPEDWYRDGFWVDSIHPKDRDWVAAYCASGSVSGRRYRFEYRMPASDGRIVWLDDIVSVVEGGDGTKRLQGVMVDITERKRAEEAAFEVREAERSRLARDLHDGVLQDLSVVVQRLEIRRVASEMEGPDSGLDREIDALRRAVRGLREAVYDLHPGEEALFLERLGEMVRRYRDLTPEREIALMVEEGFPPELPEGVATQLLRLVREALSNARQHSAARYVWVTLGTNGGELEVEVADDGRGFASGTADGGMGLSTMGERAALLGGDLEVSSEPGEGTSVRLRLARPDDAP
jgi:PAS domain S-box-containing protein